MRHHTIIAVVSCASLTLLTGACRLLTDADRFGGESADPDAGTGGIDGRGQVDGNRDAPIGIQGPCAERPPRLFNRDLFAASSGPLELALAGTYVLETSEEGQLVDPGGALVESVTMRIETAPGGGEYLLMLVDSLRIGQDTRLRAIGPRPLHIAAAETMVIEGSIDVSSNSTGVGAGGNNSPDCESGAGQSASNLSEGGGGGAFGGAGGDGGGNGPLGGTASTADLTTVLRGGCRGGDNRDVNEGPTGGNGGGALMLLACESIVLQADIEAYGQGGRATTGLANGGGAGGGSGGFVGIDTPELTMPNALGEMVNLGGGGGAGGGDATSSGGDGQDGATGLPGPRGGTGGMGGTGGQPSVPDGSNGANGGALAGGGGGGGSAGVLLDLSGPQQ